MITQVEQMYATFYNRVRCMQQCAGLTFAGAMTTDLLCLYVLGACTFAFVLAAGMYEKYRSVEKPLDYYTWKRPDYTRWSVLAVTGVWLAVAVFLVSRMLVGQVILVSIVFGCYLGRMLTSYSRRNMKLR